MLPLDSYGNPTVRERFLDAVNLSFGLRHIGLNRVEFGLREAKRVIVAGDGPFSEE